MKNKFCYFERWLSVALALAALTINADAQQPNGNPQLNRDDNVARPMPEYRTAPMPENPTLPTIWIVGDSTAENKKAGVGWGDHFSAKIDTDRINVVNRARAGRSSRTFIHEGAWDDLLKNLKPGDYVLIQMGHNDGGALSGPKPRGSLKGVGDEQQDVVLQDGSHETVHTFGWYLRKYVEDSIAKGAHPILMNLTVRNIWTDSHIERDMGYNSFIQQVTTQEHVPYVDMGNIEADKLEQLGQAKTSALFPADHTHTSVEGAELVADCVAEALRKDHTALARYLK